MKNEKTSPKKIRTLLIILLSAFVLLLMAAFLFKDVFLPENGADSSSENTSESGSSRDESDDTESDSETDSETESSSEETESEPSKPSFPPFTEEDLPAYTFPVLRLHFEHDIVYANKEYFINGTYELVTGNPEFDLSGNVGIKARGNSSLKYDKKSYNLKLDKKQNLMGLGSNKHWALLANRTDGTFMRNDLSYRLSAAFGLTAMSGAWVDVYVEGTYWGNYYLCENVRTGSTRVDIHTVVDTIEDITKAFVEKNAETEYRTIAKADLQDAMEADLSWVSTDTFTFGNCTFRVSDYYPYEKDALISEGCLLELDGYLDEASHFVSLLERPIQFKEPEYAVTNPEIMAYVEDAVNAFDAGLKDGTFRTVFRGENVSVFDIFDLDSLVAYFWIQEIFYNADGFYRSTFFYKDADDNGVFSKFKMGPVWDMDYSSGGIRVDNQSYPTTSWACKNLYPFDQKPNSWAKYLLKSEEFRRASYDFYKAFRPAIEEMLQSVDSTADFIAASALHDAVRWGYFRNDFETEVQTLKSWLTARIAWLDAQTADFATYQNSVLP